MNFPFPFNKIILPRRPSSALGHWDVVEYSEVADPVHARTWSNKKTADMDGLRYSPDDPYYILGPVHMHFFVRACRLMTGTSSEARYPEMGEGGNWWSRPRGVTAMGIPRVYQVQ